MLVYWYQLYTRQTNAEKALEKEVAKLGVRYRSQHPLLSARAILDFYFPDYNLVIEVDDPSHRTKKGIKKDQERTERLAGLGLNILRFTNEEVLTDASGCASAIYSRLKTISVLPDVDSVPLGMSGKSSKRGKKSKRIPAPRAKASYLPKGSAVASH